jgi:hypothetical protein
MEMRRNRTGSLSQYRMTVIIAFNGSDVKDRIYRTNGQKVDLRKLIQVVKDAPDFLTRRRSTKSGDAAERGSRIRDYSMQKTPRLHGAFEAGDDEV